MKHSQLALDFGLVFASELGLPMSVLSEEGMDT